MASDHITSRPAPPNSSSSPRKIIRRSNTAPIKPDLEILNPSNGQKKRSVKELAQSIEGQLEKSLTMPVQNGIHVISPKSTRIPPKKPLPPPPPRPKNTPNTTPVKQVQNMDAKLSNRPRSRSSELVVALAPAQLVVQSHDVQDTDSDHRPDDEQVPLERSYSAQSVMGLADEFSDLLDDLKSTNLVSVSPPKTSSKRNSKRISFSIPDPPFDDDELHVVPPIEVPKQQPSSRPPPPPRPIIRQAANTISTSTARNYANNNVEPSSPPKVSFDVPASNMNNRSLPKPLDANSKTVSLPADLHEPRQRLKERSKSTTSIVATFSKKKLKSLAKAFKSQHDSDNEEIQPSSSYPPSKPPPPIPTLDSNSVQEIKTINANYPQNKLWITAVSSFYSKEFPTALSTFQQITKVNSKMHFNIAMCLRNLTRYQDAVNHFTQAIRLDGSMAIAYFCRAISYQLWGIQQAPVQTEETSSLPVQYFRKAVLDYTKTYELMQTNPEMNYEPLGLKYILKRHEVMYNRALSFFQLGLYHRAKDDLVAARNLFADKNWKQHIGELMKQVNTKLQNQTLSSLTLTPHGIPQLTICTSKVYIEPRSRPTPRQSITDSRQSVTEPRHSALEPRHSSLEPRHSSLEPRYSALEPRHSSLEPRYSVRESRYSALEPRRSVRESRYSALEPRRSVRGSRNSVREPRQSVREQPEEEDNMDKMDDDDDELYLDLSLSSSSNRIINFDDDFDDSPSTDNNSVNFEIEDNQPASEIEDEVTQFIFKLTHRPSKEELIKRGILQQ